MDCGIKKKPRLSGDYMLKNEQTGEDCDKLNIISNTNNSINKYGK